MNSIKDQPEKIETDNCQTLFILTLITTILSTPLDNLIRKIPQSNDPSMYQRVDNGQLIMYNILDTISNLPIITLIAAIANIALFQRIVHLNRANPAIITHEKIIWYSIVNGLSLIFLIYETWIFTKS